MEIYEIQYFLEVARFENIHRASETLHVSPGSLSKAISRLENELGVNLFERQGRNIRLTTAGKLLKKRGSQIVQLTEDTRLEIGGHESSISIQISGVEILQSHHGLEVARTAQKLFPHSSIQFHMNPEKKVIQQVENGEAHLGLVTCEVPKGLYSQVLGKVHFRTCAGKGHPLHRRSGSIPVAELLEHGFVSPSIPMLGSVPTQSSLDGWRDDKFPRRISHRANGLKVIESVVSSGLAVAYLPDHFVRSIGAKVLDVTGCPYQCIQKVRILARNPQDLGWLSQLLSNL